MDDDIGHIMVSCLILLSLFFVHFLKFLSVFQQYLILKETFIKRTVSIGRRSVSALAGSPFSMRSQAECGTIQSLQNVFRSAIQILGRF